MSGPNSVVLITVDCLRADHVGFLGYERPTTPFLDALSQESLVFSNAIAAGVPTYYSFPAILASRYSLGLGRDVAGLAPDEPTIATTLKECGYLTAAFLAGNPYLSPRFGYDAGFDTFCDFLGENGAATGGNGLKKGSLRTRINRRLAEVCHQSDLAGSLYDELYFRYCQRFAASPPATFDTLRRYPSAEVMVNHAGDWLKGLAGRPFFLWLHLMDPHAPYYPPETALQAMGSTVGAGRARYLNSYWNRGDLGPKQLRRHRDEIIDLYDAGIRWVDTQVARLVGVMRGAGLWDSTVLALTADHGEEFLEHGGRFHSPARLTEELVRVPLLLRAPGLPPPAKTVDAPFSLLRLAPTLLDAAGAPVPAEFCGQSCWPHLQSGTAWDDTCVIESIADAADLFRAEGRLGRRMVAVRDRRCKLVFDFGSVQEQLFDLERDPGEQHPLPDGAERPLRARWLKRVQEHIVGSQADINSPSRVRARIREMELECGPSAAAADLIAV